MATANILKSKKTFNSVNDAWEAYYSDNKFAISADVQKALKYVPIYYQKRNLTAMAAAYSLWNGAEQRFEVFCPKNAVFRSTNLHELGHIYFGHLKNSRKYIAMAEKMIQPYETEIADFLKMSCWGITKNVINVCMDFEINSKLFVTKKEREELNASVQFYLLRRHDTDYVRNKLTDFDPETDLSKSTVIYFPEDFGFPGKKSFLEYVQMIIDFCVNHKKPEIPQLKVTYEKQSSDKNNSDTSFSMPSQDLPTEEHNTDADSVFNEENDDENTSNKESEMPSFNEKSEAAKEDKETDIPSSSSNEDKNDSEEEDKKEASSSEDENSSKEDENDAASNKDENDSPEVQEIDDETFGDRFRSNVFTGETKDKIKKEDKCAKRKNSIPIYDISGEDLDNEIDQAKKWMEYHESEEDTINKVKEKIEVASNASEINNFILNNALPSIDVSSYNDILYNYNRGKTKDVFINKVRTRSTFRKPNLHIYTDISGSMDPDYTKKIVKAVRAISSRIDNRSSITFYNSYPRNTEKFSTLNDEKINSSFTGGGTDLAYALKPYVQSQENNSANTLVIISDFEDNLNDIKKRFDNIKSTIICIEVGGYNGHSISDDFELYDIKNAKLLKVVDRKYAA